MRHTPIKEGQNIEGQELEVICHLQAPMDIGNNPMSRWFDMWLCSLQPTCFGLKRSQGRQERTVVVREPTPLSERVLKPLPRPDRQHSIVHGAAVTSSLFGQLIYKFIGKHT